MALELKYKYRYRRLEKVIPVTQYGSFFLYPGTVLPVLLGYRGNTAVLFLSW